MLTYVLSLVFFIAIDLLISFRLSLFITIGPWLEKNNERF